MKSANIYQGIVFNQSKPVITVIFETNFTKEIRVVMHKGTVMKEHKTPYPIIVEILDGHVDFGVKQQTKHMIKGDMIALDGNTPHDLMANENSIIRLTLSRYDDSNRVENVAAII